MEIPYYILYAPQGGVERRERTTVAGLLLHGIKALCHRNSGAGTQRKETGPHIPSLSAHSATLLSPLDLGCECKVREVTSEPGTSIRRAEERSGEGSGYGAMRQENNNEAPYPLPSPSSSVPWVHPAPYGRFDGRTQFAPLVPRYAHFF